MRRRKIHRPDQTATATFAAISQSISEWLSSSRSNAANLYARKSPMTRAIIAGERNLGGSAHIFHAELFHFARQRGAAPAQELGPMLLHAACLAQGDANQDALHLGRGIIKQPLRARVQFLLGPMRK